MNYFTKKRLAIITIIVLLIVNISTISTVLYHTHIKPKRGSFNKERTYRKTRKHMRLTREQRDLFRSKVVDYRERTEPIHHEINEIRNQILDELAKNDPDTNVIFKLNDKAAQLHLKLKRQTILNLIDLKQSWDPEQYDVLDKMFRQTLLNDHRPMPNYKYKMKKDSNERKRERRRR